MFSARASRFAILLLLSACTGPLPDPTASTESPIIGGVPSTDTDFPTAGVLLMRIDFGGGQVFATPMCTGTLIAPDVVMTAGHCTVDFFGTGMGEYFFSFTLDVSEFGQTTTDLPPRTYPVSQLYAHPQFDINSEPSPGLGDWHDVGIAFLATPVTDVTPEVVADSIDGAAMVVGSAVDIAGYGQTSQNNQAFGVKIHAVSRINEINAFEMQVGDVAPVPQKCHGDSGGPSYMTFSDGRLPAQRVVGITSRAYDDRDCEAGGIDIRADAYRSWYDQEMRGACANNTRQPAQCANGGGLPFPGNVGPVDGGISDTGVPPDSGLADTGVPDTGLSDTGTSDSGSSEQDTGTSYDGGMEGHDVAWIPPYADAGGSIAGGRDREDGCDCSSTHGQRPGFGLFFAAIFALALARARNTQRVQTIQKRS